MDGGQLFMAIPPVRRNINGHGKRPPIGGLGGPFGLMFRFAVRSDYASGAVTQRGPRRWLPRAGLVPGAAWRYVGS